MSSLDAHTLRKLSSRRPLAIDAQRAIAVKRNVHEVVVDVPAQSFAEAFHEVMAERDATFGAIEIRRDPKRAGKPFEVGERFHGCLGLALRYPRFARMLVSLGLGRFVARIENAALSDFAEITRVVHDGTTFEASYVYLSGSPIAGESVFRVESLGRSLSKFTAVFCYQEVSSVAVLVLQRLGAKLHDQVVLEQVLRATKRAGGSIVSSTMCGLVAGASVAALGHDEPSVGRRIADGLPVVRAQAGPGE